MTDIDRITVTPEIFLNQEDIFVDANEQISLEANFVTDILATDIPNILATDIPNILATDIPNILATDIPNIEGADSIKGTDSMDILIGGDQKNKKIEYIFGYAGDDDIQGGGGNDHIDGGDGDDILYGDLIDGSASTNNLNDTIFGGNGNDYLSGNGGDDYLNGGNGDDFLTGESGNDVLTGGNGGDTFYFYTPPSLSVMPELGTYALAKVDAVSDFNASFGVDTITDFTAGEDKILLSQQMFFTLSGVKDFSTVFATVINDLQAETTNALIVYNSVSGSLFYNPNGTELGLGNGGQFAVLTGAPIITASNFQVEIMSS